MNEQELGPESAPESTEETDTERVNIENEMAAIEADIEAGNTLTPELLGHFQELGGRLADRETDIVQGQLARFMLDYDSAALKFKAGYIEAAIEDLQILGDTAYQGGEQYAQIVEMADSRRAEYEAVLARQSQS